LLNDLAVTPFDAQRVRDAELIEQAARQHADRGADASLVFSRERGHETDIHRADVLRQTPWDGRTAANGIPAHRVGAANPPA
jgi:hypothetical protein